MNQLQELEQKVLQIVSINKELSTRASFLEEENRKLTEQVRNLESSLMTDSAIKSALISEKDDIKSTIDELLSSIELLQEEQR